LGMLDAGALTGEEDTSVFCVHTRSMNCAGASKRAQRSRP
jgi:hypothetical protein